MFVAGFLNRHIGTPPISFIDARYLPRGQAPENVRVGVRPEDVVVSTEESVNGTAGVVAGTLNLPMINATILSIRVEEHEVFAHVPGDRHVLAGDRVWLTFKQYHLFDRRSGARLESRTRDL
jgi:ABC-type sugar transport system ATPase subunit